MQFALLFPLLFALSQSPAAKPAGGPPSAYAPGENGVTLPQVKKQVRPSYTADARMQRIEGVVLLSAVVTREGRVTDIKILRSLDSIFGLDKQAVKAAQQWRFVPGKKDNKPADVRVTIEMTFTLK